MDDTRKAILLMNAVSFIFAVQDALSRQLGGEYSPFLVGMLRYWFLAVFVTVICARSPGGLRAAIRTRAPLMQAARGTLLILELTLVVFAFIRLGLIGTHSLFALYPLIVVALSVPMLGEKVGWRRWSAVGAGFVGMLVILQPGGEAMSADAWLAIGAALAWALYSLLTRKAAAIDGSLATFFWGGISGCVVATAVGVWFWEPLAASDWGWMALLCLCAASSHWLLIRAYELAEASLLQPFAYTQLVWVILIGVLVLNETVSLHTLIGMAIITAAGLFTLLRTRKVAQG